MLLCRALKDLSSTGNLCKVRTEPIPAQVKVSVSPLLFPHEEALTVAIIRNAISLPHHISLNFPSAIPMNEGRREDTNPTDLHLSVQRRAKQGRHSSFSLLACSPAISLTRAWAPLAIQLQPRSSTTCTSHREVDKSFEVILQKQQSGSGK